MIYTETRAEPIVSEHKSDKVLTYEFEYKQELSDDKILQKTLKFCESVSTFEVSEDTKELLVYYFTFLDQKFNEVTEIQRSLALQNSTKRLTNLAKRLDEITTSNVITHFRGGFANEVSLLLDLLHSSKIILMNVFEKDYSTKELGN